MTDVDTGAQCTDPEGDPSGSRERAGGGLLVLKFGGTSLGSAARVRRAAKRVRAHVRAGARVVVVVSANGDATDRIIRRLQAVAPASAADAGRERDRALATGEDLSAALLAAALIAAGVPAVSLRGGEAGLMGAGLFGTGEIEGADPARLTAFLDDRVVPVVSGFQAVRADGETVTLGRGGSDTTAACLAAALGARECHIVTDVTGIHDRDPHLDPTARLIPHLRYDDLLAIVAAGGQVVHPSAVRRARDAGTPLHVYRFSAARTPGSGSVVVGDGGAPRAARGPVSTRGADWDHAEESGPGAPAPTAPTAAPASIRSVSGVRPRSVRVALAGCGVVGSELVRLANAAGAPLELVRVLVRDTARERGVGLARELFTSDVEDFVRAPAEVVVEAIGGTDPAERIARAALGRGARLVTANKALIAAVGDDLADLAAATGTTLDFEAAVGGGLPIVRTLREALGGQRPHGITAILNGTTNYVLTLLEDRVPFADAVERAKANGFAEADPTRDLDGTDAADKIRIVAWLAYGVPPRSVEIEARGILHGADRLAAAARAAGGVVRLVAACRESGGRVTASVKPVIVPVGSELARVREERNHVAIEFSGWSAPLTLSGPGAGGRPTAAALLSDILRPCRPLRVQAAQVEEAEQVSAASAVLHALAG